MHVSFYQFVVSDKAMLSHCCLGDRKAIGPAKKAGCWFVDGDNLTGALHVL